MKSIADIYNDVNPGFAKITRVFSLFLILAGLSFRMMGQEFKTLKVTEKIELDGKLTEISGITYESNRVFAINDSGNSREVHVLDIETFELISSINLQGSSNIDWEEISSFNNTLYIGDFGNNFGNRKDLRIYKIELDSFLLSDKSAEKIKFRYSSQESYNMAEYKHHIYDCEAMIIDNSGIWLFSKDWIDRTTRLYKVKPDSEEKQDLRPTDSLKLNYLVTGAYFDRNNQRIFLCGYEGRQTFISIFKIEDNINISGEHSTFVIPDIQYGQVESIFVKNNLVYLASERTGIRQSVYKINISGLLK